MALKTRVMPVLLWVFDLVGLKAGALVTIKLLLIDGFNLIRRIFEARPDGSENIKAVIEACARSVGRALTQHPSSHACVVFDSHHRTWRHRLYRGYKQGRKPTPVVMLSNLQGFMQAFKHLGVTSLMVESYEADDVIATLAKGVTSLEAPGPSNVVILSTDKSFLQLLCAPIQVFNHFDNQALTRETVREKYALDVEQLTTYWALAGDASNNIKGVPKVGQKTAANLIKQYGSLEEILRDAAASAAALRVQQHRELVQQCKQLVTLKTDVQLGMNLSALRLDGRSG